MPHLSCSRCPEISVSLLAKIAVAVPDIPKHDVVKAEKLVFNWMYQPQVETYSSAIRVISSNKWYEPFWLRRAMDV